MPVREAVTFLRLARIDRRREKWPGVAPTVNRMKDEGRKRRKSEFSPNFFVANSFGSRRVPFRFNFAAFHSLFRHGVARTRPP